MKTYKKCLFIINIHKKFEKQIIYKKNYFYKLLRTIFINDDRQIFAIYMHYRNNNYLVFI